MRSRSAVVSIGLLLLAGCGVVEKSSMQTEQNDTTSIVEFHIKAGTAGGSWNTRDTIVSVRMGDTLRFINDDSIKHRLHTNGAPCPHGPDFGPGTTFDCLITETFNSLESYPLYDHNFGSTAEFWLKAE